MVDRRRRAWLAGRHSAGSACASKVVESAEHFQRGSGRGRAHRSPPRSATPSHSSSASSARDPIVDLACPPLRNGKPRCRTTSGTLPPVDADAVEIRVLGCLIEKQRTTPDVYPL